MYKYLKPNNYARGWLRAANIYGISGVESLLERHPEEPLRHPPVFFLGAPRSGSTLAVQVLTDALDFGYISNFHCHWFGAPAIAERLFHPTANRPPSDYSSSQGVTRGPHAPAECGEWWYRFFRRAPAYMTLGEVAPQKAREFRRSVMALTNAFDRPILFKNLYASLRIHAIAHSLPESLFVVIHRDEIDNGHSLLETRMNVFQTYSRWWSMEPPEIASLKEIPAHQQVIEQIRHIHALIDHDLKDAGVCASRRYDVLYEDFCADPLRMLGRVQLFLAEHGCDVKRRDLVVPRSFKRRCAVTIDPRLYEKLVAYARHR